MLVVALNPEWPSTSLKTPPLRSDLHHTTQDNRWLRATLKKWPPPKKLLVISSLRKMCRRFSLTMTREIKGDYKRISRWRQNLNMLLLKIKNCLLANKLKLPHNKLELITKNQRESFISLLVMKLHTNYNRKRNLVRRRSVVETQMKFALVNLLEAKIRV